MCDDPNTLPDGTVVACRNCELCRYNRVKDWAGRNIAQSKVSAASFACTLTYGPKLDAYPGDYGSDKFAEYGNPIPGHSDHIRAAVLTYSDVQKFLKYLRDGLGYKGTAYFVTGEVGAETSRAHWHIILHFRDRVPPHILGRNFSDRHVNQYGELFDLDVCKAWPHGFMFWKKPSFQDVFYNCKYILKDEDDDEAQRKPGMSKKPPIGAAYFVQWADLHVKQQVAPLSLEYRFPEIKKKDGTPLLFRLSGRTAEMFVERYIHQWKAVHGDLPRPKSDLVDLFEQYGKIVFDEDRMLIREHFPKGESRVKFPSAEQIKSMADEIRAEREQFAVQFATDAWQSKWVREAQNGEEQIQRQTVVEFEQQSSQAERIEAFQRFEAYKAKHGWTFQAGKGWVCESPGPNPAGSWSFVQFKRQERIERSRAIAAEQHQREQLLGKVGTWNQNYGPTHRPHKTGT